MNFFHQIFDDKPNVFYRDEITFEPHMHSAVEIIVMFAGSCTFTSNGSEYLAKKGDVIVIFPNSVHSYQSLEPVKCGLMIFNPDEYPELNKYLSCGTPESPVIPSKSLRDTNLLEFATEMFDTFEGSSSVAQKGYILLFMSKLFEHIKLQGQNEKFNDLVSRVFDYCRENYRSKITLGDVALALHVSKSHLSHIFCCKMKINFCEYLNTLRSNEAMRLLEQTGKSITEIAEASGFGTIRSFNRAFLKHTGKTPSEYRKYIK